MIDEFRQIHNLIFEYKDVHLRADKIKLLDYLKWELQILEDEVRE